MKFKMQEHSFLAQFEFGDLQISGDANYGFRPYQLLVSAIAVCSGGVLRKILDKMRISYQDIRLTSEVTRNKAEADRIEKIHIHFEIIGSHVSHEKLEKALVLTRKNCSMVQSVKDSIEITESFEIKP